MTNLGKNGKRNDQECMQDAILEAVKAAKLGEVPIGAVAVVEGQIVARAHNVRETTQDPLGHAEVLLIRKLVQQRVIASAATQSSEANEIATAPSGPRNDAGWRLTTVTIYVTCEPCLMCMGAMLQARVPRVVYGCKDPKAGACGSLYDVSNDARLNHRMAVTAGVLGDDCGRLLTDFFRAKRK